MQALVQLTGVTKRYDNGTAAVDKTRPYLLGGLEEAFMELTRVHADCQAGVSGSARKGRLTMTTLTATRTGKER